jgi:hypothetical protein
MSSPKIVELLSTLEADLVCSFLNGEHPAQMAMTAIPNRKLGTVLNAGRQTPTRPMGDVLESAINDDQRLKMINAEGTNKIKASTQWHDPGLFAYLFRCRALTFDSIDSYAAGVSTRIAARRGASCRHLLAVSPESPELHRATVNM